MVHRLDPADEGKAIVTPTGDVVGVLVRIHGRTAYVRPNPGLLDGYGSWIAGPIQDVDTFPLDETIVTEVTRDRIVIDRTNPDLIA